MLHGRALTLLLLGRYADALADCARSTGTAPDNNWSHGVSALSLRLAGNGPMAEAQFRRAIRRFAADAAGESAEATSACGDLLVLYCALPDLDRATAQREVFLGRDPARSLILEALEGLEFVRKVLPGSGTGVDPLLLRLRAALVPVGGPATGPGET